MEHPSKHGVMYVIFDDSVIEIGDADISSLSSIIIMTCKSGVTRLCAIMINATQSVQRCSGHGLLLGQNHDPIISSMQSNWNFGASSLRPQDLKPQSFKSKYLANRHQFFTERRSNRN